MQRGGAHGIQDGRVAGTEIRMVGGYNLDKGRQQGRWITHDLFIDLHVGSAKRRLYWGILAQ